MAAAASGAGGPVRVDEVEFEFPKEDGTTTLVRGERLGSGSGGRVFELLGRYTDSVLKVTKGSDSREAMRLTADEIEKLSTVRDISNAIQVRSPDAVTTRDGSPALLMERAVGLPLDVLTRSGRLTPQDVRHVAKGLFRTIQDLHEQQIFHGDLKPANITYNQGTGEIKVLDWALLDSKVPYVRGIPAADRTMKFTHWYRPPSWIEGKMPRYPDLWSLACTVAEAGTGRPLFQIPEREGDDENTVLMEVIRHVLDEEVSTKPEIKRILQLKEYEDFLSPDVRQFVKSILTLGPSPTLKDLSEQPCIRDTRTFFCTIPAAEQGISELTLQVKKDVVWTAPATGSLGANYQLPAARKYQVVWTQGGKRHEQSIALPELARLSFDGKEWIVETPLGERVVSPTSCAVS